MTGSPAGTRCLPAPARMPAHPWLALLVSSPRSAPTVAVASTTQTSAAVTVAQPGDAPAGGWSKYEVTACRDLALEATCPIKKQECAFVAAGSTCTLDALNSNTKYQVVVRGRAAAHCLCRAVCG